MKSAANALTKDDLAKLKQIEEGQLHFIDRDNVENLIENGLAEVSEGHILITKAGREALSCE